MYTRSFNNTPRRGSKPTRGSFSGAFHKKEIPLAQLMKGLGEEIETINVPSDAGDSIPISIQDLEAVASYSWLDSKSPTIIVPGSPPIWRERSMPYAVPRDTGTVFVDQNASRLGSSPLLPLIAAVTHHAPSFPLDSVDFVTDRNGLRKLWRWAIGHDRDSGSLVKLPGISNTGVGPFRIDVELVGKRTILMERWNAEATQTGGPGYEREFEGASTTPAEGCEKASGHHRIVTYDLSGLKMLVRFKVDACLPVDKKEALEAEPLDELTSKLESLNVTKSPKAPQVQVPTFDGVSLTVNSCGTLVSQSRIVELKTRSVQSVSQFDWGETYPQLLLSQTPHVFICVHQRGEFQSVRKRALNDLETETMAREAHDGLRKLRMVLGEIRDIVIGEGESTRLSLVCKDGGDIVVYERGGKEGFLPLEILERFRV